MVTIDNYVENVKAPFNGDIQAGRKDYERAVQGLEKVDQRLSILEQAIKNETEYSDVNLPTEPITVTLKTDDVHFDVDCYKSTKRPAYKGVVESMEKYLSGIALLVVQRKEVEGVIKRGKDAYIEVDTLLEAYEIIVAGFMKPETKLTIKYKTIGTLDKEGVPERVRIGKEDLPKYLFTATATLSPYVQAFQETPLPPEKQELCGSHPGFLPT